MSKKVKIFIIVIGIIAVLIFAFNFFGNNTPASTTTAGIASNVSTSTSPSATGATGTSASSSSFTALLSSISGITLDTSIFSNPGYKALRDYPLSLGTAVIGRQNPFAPLGVDSTGTSIATAVQVQTLAPGKILSTTAELGALVTAANTSPSTVVFQYGTTDTVTSSSAPIKVTQNGTALYTLTGLTPATTYYVEAVAVQGSTTATGTIMSFTTAPKQKQ
ncbi:MAG: hypothetical protein ABIO57_01775 [Candidatus Paceibacterota bacterium]